MIFPAFTNPLAGGLENLFGSPIVLLLFFLLPPLIWFHKRNRRQRSALRFSTIANAIRSGKSLRQAFIWLPDALRLLTLIFLIIALARPRIGTEKVRDVSQGIAIEMIVDRSGSMKMEMEYEGQRMTRLDVVKRVFAQFVNGGGKLKGRPNDLIGMVAFARYPDSFCPLTLGHGALNHFLENVHLVTRRSEDGTAIGDALALAAANLYQGEKDLAKQTGNEAEKYRIKSKIAILLTDGENNCGDRTVEEAAELARQWGIKVYSIGVTGEAVGAVQGIFGNFVRQMHGASMDTSTLEAIAETTGGKFFLAEDAESLTRIYEEIDQLERSEIEADRYVDYREIFIWFAAAALVLLALEIILNCTVFRRVP